MKEGHEMDSDNNNHEKNYYVEFTLSITNTASLINHHWDKYGTKVNDNMIDKSDENLNLYIFL